MDGSGVLRPPRRHRRRRRAGAIAAGTLAVAVGLLAYLLLWGKLFPYSPVAVGFTRHEQPRSLVYVQNGADFADYARIDSLVPEVEATHDLRFVRKPRLFVFRDDRSYLRRSPTKARFCAFYSGALVISPWALREDAQGQISLDIYLRHELSHVLLFQHAGLWCAHHYPPWLREGIATYTADQMGTSFYPDKEETYRLIREGNFMPPALFQTRWEDQVKLDVKYPSPFMYSEFACLVDYLVGLGGRARFWTYARRLLVDSDQERAFREAYGMSLDEALARFRDHVGRAGQG